MIPLFFREVLGSAKLLSGKLRAPGVNFRLRTQVLLISVLFLLLVSLVTWMVVSSSQDSLIEFEAVKLAEVVAGQAGAARSAYSNLAVSKLSDDGYGASEVSSVLKGHIPLPAQFLRELSEASQSAPDALYSFRPISKWNLAPDQGVVDDFQRWAWEKLETQEMTKTKGVVDWKPVWRIERNNGEQTLRYLKSDPAVSQSCVDCHNSLEKRAYVIAERVKQGTAPGKTWALNDLLGAIEINIPLDRAIALAKSQSKQGLFTVLGVTVIGLIGLVVLVFIDSARNRALTSELSYQARHDSLTGLPNRLQFEIKVTECIEKQQHFSIMLLDLDNFKQINDTLGHEAGDSVLCESGTRIESIIPNSATVARLGGDEFAVLIPGSKSAIADGVATDISNTIGETYNVKGYAVTLGVSIGVAMYPVNGTEMTELMRCADVAMYQAKNAGVASTFYDATHDQNFVSTLLLYSELREAINANALKVHFQPKYCMDTGRMLGVEALARWVSEKQGYVSPEVFIPLAERLGLINELTGSILELSLIERQKWTREGFDLTVAVNLSAFSIRDSKIVDLVKEKLITTNTPPESLIVEVTESAMMTDQKKSIAVLNEIRALGVKISVDDYGIGYCSLSYLAMLPISELKLDKTFIQKMQASDKEKKIVKATLDLSRSLNLKMVAEGVEDPATLDALCEMGCDIVQGYFLCRPLSMADFIKRLPYIYRFTPRVRSRISKTTNDIGELDDSGNLPQHKAA